MTSRDRRKYRSFSSDSEISEEIPVASNAISSPTTISATNLACCPHHNTHKCCCDKKETKKHKKKKEVAEPKKVVIVESRDEDISSDTTSSSSSSSSSSCSSSEECHGKGYVEYVSKVDLNSGLFPPSQSQKKVGTSLESFYSTLQQNQQQQKLLASSTTTPPSIQSPYPVLILKTQLSSRGGEDSNGNGGGKGKGDSPNSKQGTSQKKSGGSGLPKLHIVSKAIEREKMNANSQQLAAKNEAITSSSFTNELNFPSNIQFKSNGLPVLQNMKKTSQVSTQPSLSWASGYPQLTHSSQLSSNVLKQQTNLNNTSLRIKTTTTMETKTPDITNIRSGPLVDYDEYNHSNPEKMSKVYPTLMSRQEMMALKGYKINDAISSSSSSSPSMKIKTGPLVDFDEYNQSINKNYLSLSSSSPSQQTTIANTVCPTLMSRKQFVALQGYKNAYNGTTTTTTPSSQLINFKDKLTWNIKDFLPSQHDSLRTKLATTSLFNSPFIENRDISSYNDFFNLSCDSNDATICPHAYLVQFEEDYEKLLVKHGLIGKIKGTDGIIVIIPSENRIQKMLERVSGGVKSSIEEDRIYLGELLLKPNDSGKIDGFHSTIDKKKARLLTPLLDPDRWHYATHGIVVKHKEGTPDRVLYQEKDGILPIEMMNLFPISKFSTSSKSFSLTYKGLNGIVCSNFNGDYNNHLNEATSSFIDSSISSSLQVPKEITLKQISLLNVYNRYKESVNTDEIEIDNYCVKNVHTFTAKLGQRNNNDDDSTTTIFQEYKHTSTNKRVPLLTKADFTAESLFELLIECPHEKNLTYNVFFNKNQLNKDEVESSFVLSSSDDQQQPLAVLTFNKNDELSSFSINKHLLEKDNNTMKNCLISQKVAALPTILSLQASLNKEYSSMHEFANDFFSFEANKLGKLFKRKVLKKKEFEVLTAIPKPISLKGVRIIDSKPRKLTIERAKLADKRNISLQSKELIFNDKKHAVEEEFIFTSDSYKIVYNLLPPVSKSSFIAKNPYGLYITLQVPQWKKKTSRVTHVEKSVAIGFRSFGVNTFASFQTIMRGTSSTIFKSNGHASGHYMYLFFDESNLYKILYTNVSQITLEGVGGGTSFKSSTSLGDLDINNSENVVSIDTSKEDRALIKLIVNEVNTVSDMKNKNDISLLLECRMNSISDHFKRIGFESDIYHIEGSTLGLFNTLITKVMTLASEENITLTTMKDESPFNALKDYDKVSEKLFVTPLENDMEEISNVLCQFGNKVTSSCTVSSSSSSNENPQQKRFKKVVRTIFDRLNYNKMDRSQKSLCLKTLNTIGSYFMKSVLTINSFHKETFKRQEASSFCEQYNLTKMVEKDGFNRFQEHWNSLSSNVNK
jgi:hypothetical protein